MNETDVIALVERVVSADDRFVRDDAYWTLRRQFVEQSVWRTGSVGCVSALLSSLDRARNPARALQLVADIIGGDQLRAWLVDPSPARDQAEGEVRSVAAREKVALVGALEHARDTVRGAAAMTLAMLPDLFPDVLDRVLAMASSDGNDVARASALLALGRMGTAYGTAPRAVIVAAISADARLVRGAAAVALLRMDPVYPPEAAASEIEDWLSFRGRTVGPDDDLYEGELPWFLLFQWYRGLPFVQATARTISALARSRGREATLAFADVVERIGLGSQDGCVETQCAKVLLDLGKFRSDYFRDDVVPLSDLSPENSGMARRLARGMLLPKGRFRIPAAGSVRRRWAGIDPPGPFEQWLESQKCRPASLWESWREALRVHNREALAVDAIGRWQAIVELASWAYPSWSTWCSAEEMAQELASLPVSTEMIARVGLVANDLADRVEAMARAGLAYVPSFTASTLLFAPLIRAGEEIVSRWDKLIYVGGEPQARDVLRAIPDDRREQLLLRELGESAGINEAGRVAAVFELCPTDHVRVAIERVLVRLERDPRFDHSNDVRVLRAKLESG